MSSTTPPVMNANCATRAPRAIATYREPRDWGLNRRPARPPGTRKRPEYGSETGFRVPIRPSIRRKPPSWTAALPVAAPRRPTTGTEVRTIGGRRAPTAAAVNSRSPNGFTRMFVRKRPGNRRMNRRPHVAHVIAVTEIACASHVTVPRTPFEGSARRHEWRERTIPKVVITIAPLRKTWGGLRGSSAPNAVCHALSKPPAANWRTAPANATAVAERTGPATGRPAHGRSNAPAVERRTGPAPEYSTICHADHDNSVACAMYDRL